MIADFQVQVRCAAFNGAAQQIVNIDGHRKFSRLRGFSQASTQVLGWQECQGRGVLDRQPDLWDRWQGLGRGLIAEVEAIVNYASEDANEERAGPVHANVGPM